MTINDFKGRAISVLENCVDNPQLETEQLLMWALHMTRTDIIIRRRETIPDNVEKLLMSAVRRRLSREPLQYILGEWDFYGLRMFCGSGCLIPRPETELLVDFAVKNLPRGGHLLDLCTGSGCIPVAVLNNRPDVTATAIDISETALNYARKNAAYHNISADRLRFRREDILDFTPIEIPDVIVSNPPYIKTEDVEALQREVLFEPYIALNGGYDGLDFYKIIASKYSRYLKSTSLIAVEIGYDISREVDALFRGKRFQTELLCDAHGIERVCVARLPS